MADDRRLEQLLDELDQQEMHLRRLARRIDQRRGRGVQLELRVLHRLQSELERVSSVANWGNADPPPGFPDVTLIWMTRSLVQRDLILELAGEVEAVGANPFRDKLQHDLQQGHDRMPFALESRFQEGPVLVPPGALSRDFLELTLNAQQEALLQVDLALDRLK